jgi:hypothetical protein
MWNASRRPCLSFVKTFSLYLVLVSFITQTFKVLISNHGGHLGLIRPLSFKAVFVFVQNVGIQFFFILDIQLCYTLHIFHTECTE